MGLRREKDDTALTRKNTRVIDRYTTTDEVPVVAFSIPLGESRCSYGTFRISCVQSNYSRMAVFTAVAGFRREAGGNITRIQAPQINRMDDWTGIRPAIDLVANTVRQTIDVTVTGTTATTIYWFMDIESIQNLTA